MSGPDPGEPPAPRLLLRLGTWLMLSHLSVLLLPLAAMIGTGAMARDLWQQTREDIDHQATLWRLTIEAELEEDPDLDRVLARVQPRLAEARDQTLAGVRVVDAGAVVRATSSGAGVGEDVADDPEVRLALAGAPGWDVRPREAPTTFAPLSSASRRSGVRVFVAQPIRRRGAGGAGDGGAGEIVGAVLVSRTPREELQALYQFGPGFSLGMGLSLVATLGMAFYAGRRFTDSISGLVRASQRIAAGDAGATSALRPALGSHVIETRRLAEAMEAMQRRLAERVAYITEFSANVSHEFKTPVTTLRGTLEILRDDDELPPAQRTRFLDNALADLDRLSRMVSGLLALARAEEGGGREAVDLAGLARAAAERAGVEFLSDAGAAGAAVWGNAGQLEAVLKNLIQNAQLHGKAPISVTLEAEGGAARVRVVDHGGISAGNLERVFDRFFTTARARGGTGLGLSLVRAICEAHGGRITVESREGYTCFLVELPIMQREGR